MNKKKLSYLDVAKKNEEKWYPYFKKREQLKWRLKILDKKDKIRMTMKLFNRWALPTKKATKKDKKQCLGKAFAEWKSMHDIASIFTRPCVAKHKDYVGRFNFNGWRDRRNRAFYYIWEAPNSCSSWDPGAEEWVGQVICERIAKHRMMKFAHMIAYKIQNFWRRYKMWKNKKIKLCGRVIISKWYAMRPENNCILYAKKILERFGIDTYLWSQVEQFIDFFDWREDPNYWDRFYICRWLEEKRKKNLRRKTLLEEFKRKKIFEKVCRKKILDKVNKKKILDPILYYKMTKKLLMHHKWKISRMKYLMKSILYHKITLTYTNHKRLEYLERNLYCCMTQGEGFLYSNKISDIRQYYAKWVSQRFY